MSKARISKLDEIVAQVNAKTQNKTITLRLGESETAASEEMMSHYGLNMNKLVRVAIRMMYAEYKRNTSQP